jgi:hypothetical protein
MALVLNGYSVERREFDVFWSHRHVGSHRPHELPKQLRLLAGMSMDADLVSTWLDAFPDSSVADWRHP